MEGEQRQPNRPVPARRGQRGPALFRTALPSTLHTLFSFLLALVPTAVFVIRICSSSSPIKSRTSRFILCCCAEFYFPFLTVVSTRVTTFLFGLLRGAVSLRAFLRRLCDAITDPIIETLGASERYIPLDDLQSKLQENMHRIMRQALGLDHDNHAVSVLKKFVGNLIWIGLRAALGALSFVIERRLKNAVPPGRPMQLSVPAAVAVLREEVLGAVMAPIRRSLQMYLVATIFTSAVLMCAPFYILKWFSQ